MGSTTLVVNLLNLALRRVLGLKLGKATTVGDILKQCRQI